MEQPTPTLDLLILMLAILLQDHLFRNPDRDFSEALHIRCDRIV